MTGVLFSFNGQHAFIMNHFLRPLYKALSLTLAAVTLSSCADKKVDTTAPAKPALARNTGYSSTSVKRAVPRNPNLAFSSDFSVSSASRISHGNRSQKYIALTFDDGPVPANTNRLLDILRRRNVKATFYVVGNRVKNHPSIIRRMVAEGHEVGNHTWGHPNLTKLSDAAVRSELNRTRDAIVSACGVQPRTMRPPYGALSVRQRQWIYGEYGYPSVMWDVDPEDWKKPGAGVVANRLISRTRNGSILLVHDLHSSSVDAMPRTVDALLRKGYQFVTVSQLIALNAANQ